MHSQHLRPQPASASPFSYGARHVRWMLPSSEIGICRLAQRIQDMCQHAHRKGLEFGVLDLHLHLETISRRNRRGVTSRSSSPVRRGLRSADTAFPFGGSGDVLALSEARLLPSRPAVIVCSTSQPRPVNVGFLGNS